MVSMRISSMWTDVERAPGPLAESGIGGELRMELR